MKLKNAFELMVSFWDYMDKSQLAERKDYLPEEQAQIFYEWCLIQTEDKNQYEVPMIESTSGETSIDFHSMIINNLK